MNFWFFVGLSATILLPVLASFFRLRETEGGYLPFFLLLWAGAVNEAIKLYLVLHHRGHAVTSNAFSLVQVLLLVWQFRNWGLFGRRAGLFLPVLVLVAGAWLVSTLVFPQPRGFNTLFHFFSSLVLALMALSVLSRQIIRNQVPLLKDPVFLVSGGVAFFFAYASLTEVLWWAGLYRGDVFQTRVYVIFSFVNFFTNLLFFVAVLWIPRKRPFLLRYS